MMHTDYNRNGGLTLIPVPKLEAFTEIVKKEIGEPVDVVTPKFGLRASQEPFIKLGKTHIGGHDCVILTSGPGSYEMLVQLQLLLGYLVARRAGRITVVCGYLPLSRSDKDDGDEELALVQQIIHLIMSATHGCLNRIIAADLHSPQVVMAARQGLITQVSLMELILATATADATTLYGNRPICFLFPDQGAQKSYEKAVHLYSQKIGRVFPTVTGTKRRSDSQTVSLLGFHGDVEAMRGSVVISIDDEIATGGTNINTAKAALNQGAATYWAASIHPVFCGQAVANFSTPDCPVERVYTTDTIPVTDRGLEPLIVSSRLQVVSWAHEAAQIIRLHHWDTNIY